MKRLHQIPETKLLETDFKTENSFSKYIEVKGSKQNQNLVNYVKKLFSEYVKERSKGKTSDMYLINKELLKRFRDDFYNFIIEYQDSLSSKIDLDDIFTSEVVKKDIDQRIVDEIKTVITLVLKQVIKENIKSNKTSNSKTDQISVIVKKYTFEKMSNSEVESIVSRILTNSHPFIKNLSKEFKTTIKKIDLKYKNKLKSINLKYKNKLKTIQVKNTLPNINLNFFKGKNQNKNTLKLVNILTDNILNVFDYKATIIKKRSLALNVFLNTIASIKIAKNVIGKFLSVTSKITRFVKKIIKWTVEKTMMVVNFLILRPIHFVLSTAISSVFSLSKKLLGLTLSISHSILKASKIQYTLLTPYGMYAVGFLVGFLWTKLSAMLKKHSNKFKLKSFDPLIPSIDVAFDLSEGLISIINNFCDTVGDRYPWLKDFKAAINDFADNVARDGFIETFKKLPIIKFVKQLTSEYIIDGILLISKIAVNLSKWISEHQELAEFILGTYGIYSGANIMSNFLGKFKPVGVKGIIGSFIGSLMAYTSYTATSGIMDMFDKADETSLKFNSMELKINQSMAWKKVTGSTDKKLKSLIDSMTEDTRSIEELHRVYNLFYNMTNGKDVDQNTVFREWDIPSIDAKLEWLQYKYLGKESRINTTTQNIPQQIKLIKEIQNSMSELFGHISISIPDSSIYSEANGVVEMLRKLQNHYKERKSTASQTTKTHRHEVKRKYQPVMSTHGQGMSSYYYYPSPKEGFKRVYENGKAYDEAIIKKTPLLGQHIYTFENSLIENGSITERERPLVRDLLGKATEEEILSIHNYDKDGNAAGIKEKEGYELFLKIFKRQLSFMTEEKIENINNMLEYTQNLLNSTKENLEIMKNHKVENDKINDITNIYDKDNKTYNELRSEVTFKKESWRSETKEK